MSNLISGKESFVYDFGVNDFSRSISVKGKHIPEYKLWKAMLRRCYSEALISSRPKYSNCFVDSELLSFDVFYNFIREQKGFGYIDSGGKSFHMDKDILVKGNKMYSEDTCCFIPPEINCALVTSGSRRGQHPQGVIYNSTKTRYRARIQRGNKWESLGAYDTPEEAFAAYKPIKEAHIKSLANKWKDQIDVRVYDALMNWTIEVTD